MEVTEYQRTDTPTPPLLVIVEGRVYVEVTNGSLTMRAPVGDGSWFFSQVVTKLVDPALRAAYPRGEFISPND
jgi:hypothetical protein